MLEPVTARMLSEDELKEVLKLVTSLTQMMLCAAKEGEWDRVVDLEQQRAPQLEILSSKLDTLAQSGATSVLLREAVTSIIVSDKEVVILATSQKDALVHEARDLESSRKAVNAYLNNL